VDRQPTKVRGKQDDIDLAAVHGAGDAHGEPCRKHGRVVYAGGELDQEIQVAAKCCVTQSRAEQTNPCLNAGCVSDNLADGLGLSLANAHDVLR
jgi:hypothetical protein